MTILKAIILITIIILAVITCSANSKKETFKIEENGNEYIISADNINDEFIKVEITDEIYEFTPLMFASYSGNYELATFSIRNGADVNAEDSFGFTILMWASSGGNLEMVKLLVENGADIDAKDYEGCSSLMWASLEGHLEIVKYLVEKGADINIKNEDGNTALDWAATEEIKEVLRKAGYK